MSRRRLGGDIGEPLDIKDSHSFLCTGSENSFICIGLENQSSAVPPVKANASTDQEKCQICIFEKLLQSVITSILI